MDQNTLYNRLLDIGLTLNGTEQNDAVEKLRAEFEAYMKNVATSSRDRDILENWWDYAITGAAREILSRQDELTVGKLLHHIKHRLSIGDITLDYGVSLHTKDSPVISNVACTATVERLNASGEVNRTEFLLCNYLPPNIDPLVFPEYNKKEIESWLNNNSN